MATDVCIVLISIVLMVFLLAKDYLRPGLILFSVVVLLMAAGILSPAEAVAGFSNKGMITVALLFLVSEGVRRSDCLGPMMKSLFPSRERASVRRGYASILTTVASISAFLNNTPIVVIFIPHIKAWCQRVGLPLKKFLIPLSYAAILGGMCTLIGTSTNLVVHGLMLDAGMEGFSMFELGKVGLIIAGVGLLYIILLGDRRLPNDDPQDQQESKTSGRQLFEVVLGPRFPGIRTRVDRFDFEKHYGARILAIRREGEELEQFEQEEFKENDTLVLVGDSSFMETWGDSRIFLIMTNGREHTADVSRWKRWLAFALLGVMVAGATLSEAPFMQRIFGEVKPDMFFWAALVAVVMAFCGIFPAKKYTKFISWDILITIASALAISRAMTNSGLADWIASGLINLSGNVSSYVILAALYLTTNLITELITNNAAAAFAFPIALSAATQLGVNPMPFCVAICMAASASFSSPIGYQTNMIVQGLGGYKFGDFVRIGLPLNILSFVISMIFIPLFWKF